MDVKRSRLNTVKNQKEFDSDFRYMADVLERLVKRQLLATPQDVMEIAGEIAMTYMRGEGLKLGNHTNFFKHNVTLAIITTNIILHVCKRDGNKISYPTLYGMGLKNEESLSIFAQRCR